MIDADETRRLEMSVIGLALSSPRALREMDQVTPAHFADELHAEAWRLIREMDTTGEPVTPITFKANLGRMGEHVRHRVKATWITDCMHVAPVDALAETHARLTINAATMREFEAVVERGRQLADTATDATDAIEALRGELDTITPQTVAGSMLADHIAASIAAFDQETPSIPTPWRALNNIIGGWRPGGLYVIGARPGAGKSMWAIQAALRLAETGPVAFNTLEMSVHEVNQRIIAHSANVWLSQLQGTVDGRPMLTVNDRALIEDARQHLVRLPLSVRDDRSVTVTQIRAHARSLSRKAPLAGIVVDYLQLLRTERGDNRPRHEIVADYSRNLKNLAGEMDCPVIALSQLNRGAAGGPPSLANLRESGALEQDADVVALLALPESKDDQGEIVVDETRLSVDVAKNRHGPPGRFSLARIGGKSTLGTRDEIEPLHHRKELTA